MGGEDLQDLAGVAEEHHAGKGDPGFAGCGIRLHQLGALEQLASPMSVQGWFFRLMRT